MLTFKRTIGFWHATMIGVGALIGAGVFILIGEVTVRTGPAVILVYALAACSAILTALVYAELATTYQKAGGSYTFVKETIGGYPAFLTGWVTISGSIVALSLGALGFSAFLSALLGITNSWLMLGLALSCIYCLGIVNFISVTKASSLEFILAIIKIFILAGIAILGFFNFEPSNFQNFWDKGVFACISSISLIYLCYSGMGSIASLNEEIKNPDKTIPRAIFCSLFFTTTIYLLLAVSLVGSFHLISFANPATALNELASASLRKTGLFIMSITAILAIISSMNAGVLSSSRQIYAMGRDHFLPFYLSRIHKNFHTPHFSILLICVLSTLLISFNSIVWIARLASVTYLVNLILINLALMVSRKKHTVYIRPFKIPLHPLVPILAIIINALIIAFSGWQVILDAIIWIIVGLVCYTLAQHYQTRWHMARIKIYNLFYRYKHHLQNHDRVE